MTDQNSFEQKSPTEPAPATHADEGKDEEIEFFDFYEFDKQRRKMVKEKLGVDIILSQVRYIDANGQLVTEWYTDYARRIFIRRFPTFETFLTAWLTTDRKQSIVAELYYQGIFMDKLQEMLGTDLDPYDLICHLAFDCKARTRLERANQVRGKAEYLDKYGKAARNIVDVVVKKFSEDGYITLDKMLDDVLLRHSFSTPPFDEFGSPLKLYRAFGGKKHFKTAMRELQDMIYQD